MTIFNNEVFIVVKHGLYSDKIVFVTNSHHSASDYLCDKDKRYELLILTGQIDYDS